MARLDGENGSPDYLMQKIGNEVILFQEHTEEEIVRYPFDDANEIARAQKIIHSSEKLTDEQKCFAHFWSGYFYGFVRG